MSKKKIIIIIFFLIISSILINSIDKRLRYGLGLKEYNKYNSPLTEKEIDLISQKDFLVGVYNYPPLAYTNKYNNYNTGIIIDYLSQLAIELTSDIHTKVGRNKNLYESLDNNEVDIMVVETRKDKEFNKNLRLTQPLSYIRSKILVKKNSDIINIKHLNGKIFVTLKKDNLDGSIEEFFYDKSDVKILEVDNMYEGFALLDKNIVAGIIGDDMAITHFLNVTNKNTHYRFLQPIIYEKEISLGVKEKNEEILDILNKGILQLKKKNLIAQTQYKWLGNYDSGNVDLKSIKIAYKVLIGALILIGIFTTWNYSIIKKVNEKTRELSESREELKLIIETMKNGILVIDNNSTVIKCNNSISRMTKIPKIKLIGSRYKYLTELKPFVNKNNMNKICNIGDSYYYITSKKIIGNKEMIVVEDYTDKYLKEKTERQESKMIAIGQLSAGLAHEIRNPLGLIKSYTYVIENHNPGEVCKQAICVINDSVDRINNLIENLLRFSKFSNDEIKLVNIKKIIKNVIDIEISDSENLVTINFLDIYKEDILIHTEVLRIVLINLINNSIESFEGVKRENKKIDLNIVVKENQINIIVSDNGSGIEKDKLEKIFNPFFSTKETGTGLGLYIISTEITNNNGEIQVYSKKGEGTVFDIILPIWSD